MTTPKKVKPKEQAKALKEQRRMFEEFGGEFCGMVRTKCGGGYKIDRKQAEY